MHSRDNSSENLTITILIAAYNESDIIAETLTALRKITQINRILVVDDGSTDNTADIAQDNGACVKRLSKNVGKGAALATAIPETDDDIVLFLDGDLGACASEAYKLVLPILDGSADMVIGDFPKAKKKGGFGLVKGLGAWGIRHFSKYEPHEPLSGQRAVLRRYLEGIKIEPGYGLEVGLTIDIIRKGCRVLEVPVNMTHRETGRDLQGFVHRGRQFYDILVVILKRLLADN